MRPLEEFDRQVREIQGRLTEKETNELNIQLRLMGKHLPPPFTKMEFILRFVQECGKTSFGEYKSLSHKHRKRNPYLYWYPHPNTTLSKESAMEVISLNPNCIFWSSNRNYDLCAKNDKQMNRLECKCGRALREADAENQYSCDFLRKAVYYDQTYIDCYQLFDHMKPSLCDVFVLIGIWPDYIGHWVVPSSDMVPMWESGVSGVIQRDMTVKKMLGLGIPITKIDPKKLEFQIRMVASNRHNFDKYWVENKKDVYDRIMMASPGEPIVSIFDK